MKIVHVATEAHPFFKTGGLGDVVGALSKAQAKLGHEVFVIMPRFSQIGLRRSESYWVSNIGFNFNKHFVGAGIYYQKHEGVHYFFLENETYFQRQNAYGENDDAERFGAFSQMVIEVLDERQLNADIIHLHDWQSAMVAPLLRRGYAWNAQLNRAKIVQTIHNLQFQGVDNIQKLSQFFQFPLDEDVIKTMTNFGNMNYLKSGLYYCDQITTVSRTYVYEIQTPAYGEQLYGDLQALSYKMKGIINGIDDEDYNPSRLWKPYNAKNAVEIKAELKADLQAQLGLEVNETKPLYVAITRLADQKGWDLLLYAAEEAVKQGGQFVLLGTGDKACEHAFRELAHTYAGNLCAYIGFDDMLARHIYAASDFFLMPSKFEPCGIGQLLAMRYGSIPIVRSTGGLVDTVIPFDFETEEGNGIRFNDYDHFAIDWALGESRRLYSNKKQLHHLLKQNMLQDLSWDKAAKEYIDVYQSLIK